MLNSKFKGFFKLPLRLIPIAVFCIMSTAAINILIANVSYTTVKNSLEETASIHRQEIWNEIEDVIETGYYTSKLNSKIIALNLENSIVKQYDNLDDLKSQFETENFSEKFHQILQANLLRDDVSNRLVADRYLTIIGTSKYVLTTFSNDDTSNIRQMDSTKVVTWDDISNRTPVPSMTKEAINQVINKSSGVIFTKTSEESDSNNINIPIKLEALKEVYDRGGLEALYDYSIVAPAYITENGDIFGTGDRTYLHQNHNNKLMIIQFIGLEPLLNDYTDYLAEKIKNNDMSEENIEDYMLQILLTTATISLMLFLISVILVGIHNAESRRCSNREECKMKGA